MIRSKKDWAKATNRVLALLDKEVRPVLQRAVNRTLVKFPKAKSVTIMDAMGRVWIQIDGLSFHMDNDLDTAIFSVYGCGRNRTIRAHRLQNLAEVMLECGEFLDQFHASFPEIKAERK